jgi:hypothetical protein
MKAVVLNLNSYLLLPFDAAAKAFASRNDNAPTAIQVSFLTIIH